MFEDAWALASYTSSVGFVYVAYSNIAISNVYVQLRSIKINII